MNNKYASEENKTSIFYRVFVVFLVAFLLIFAIAFFLIKLVGKKTNDLSEDIVDNKEYKKRDFILMVAERHKGTL